MHPKTQKSEFATKTSGKPKETLSLQNPLENMQKLVDKFSNREFNF